jgi:hypothetical protein
MSTEQPKTAAAPAVDVSKLSEEEKAYYEKFGMLPKKSLASAMLDKRRGKTTLFLFNAFTSLVSLLLELERFVVLRSPH